MYVRSEVRSSIVLWFCWKYILFFAAYSLAIVFAYSNGHLKFLAIPFLPIGTIGTAVAFYVGFKNNASYERLWEGRKIWSVITDQCRALSALAVAIPDNDDDVKDFSQRIVRRQIAWANALRITLRSVTAHRNSHRAPTEGVLIQSIFGKDYGSEKVEDYLKQAVSEDDLRQLRGAFNNPLRLLEMQLADIQMMAMKSPAVDKVCGKLVDIIVDCMSEQGSSERLKSFPFPRQYAYFSGVFVWIFLLLLPFGLIDELAKASALNLSWLVVPFNTLISWMFLTMEQVGDTSEDPFELALNDVPLTAICRNIEIELLQMLGETDLPKAIEPVSDILM